MSCALVHNSYGKSRVRLTRVSRLADRHDLRELSVDIQLEGDFDAAYEDGDNSKVVATDSMKNTVYVLAAQHPIDYIESFGKTLAGHFLARYAQVRSARIHLTEDLWLRMQSNGKPHPHSFVGGGSEKRVAIVELTRSGGEIQSGIEGLIVLKTTASEFSGFVRDEFTTLPEVKDRIFATAVDAIWHYRSDEVDFNACHTLIRQALIDTFAAHHSLSVQQTLYAMGEQALSACADLEQITLIMPNQHRIPFDLTRFGLANRNEIFVPTDEPYGLITGTVQRAKGRS